MRLDPKETVMITGPSSNVPTYQVSYDRLIVPAKRNLVTSGNSLGLERIFSFIIVFLPSIIFRFTFFVLFRTRFLLLFSILVFRMEMF